MEQAEERIFLSVVIPAYNEEKRISKTLVAVAAYLKKQRYPSELLVVIDGAKDNTAGVVGEFAAGEKAKGPSPIRRIEALQYPDRKNRGKGYAVRYGMLKAEGRYRVFMDSDNSTTLDHIEKFLELARRENYDIVIGSRDIKGADIAVHQPWYKELAGNIGNLFIRIMAVPGIYDTQAGFKLFAEEPVTTIFPLLTIDRWGFDVEILAVAKRKGYRIKEAPITWVNDPNSKVSLKSYFEVLLEVVSVRLNIWKNVYGPKDRTRRA